ncbi:hypothetical protein PLICBS_003871, partial [Purpureocillium lilacinum]|uniref:uncharacterized protein n=1 Tax=Purpureocillium lilacinum TaxID=33203 RepID=UPI002089FE1F
MDWHIETPEVIFYGDTDESSGALFSGKFLLDIKGQYVNVEYLRISLVIHTDYKHPYRDH